MKFFLDNCLPPRLARALQVLCEPDQITPLKDKFAVDTPDEQWIAALASEEDWVIVSGDVRITRNPQLRAAWLQSGLTAFFCPPGYTNVDLWEQAHLLIRWWPALVEKARRASAPTGFFIKYQASPQFEEFGAPRDKKSKHARKGRGARR